MKITKRLRIPKNEQEEYLREMGFDVICGVDEVGRGAWAGPLVAAAVILDKKLNGLRDSKLLNRKEREKLSLKIRRKCVWGVGVVSVSELETLKMTKGTQLAFSRAIENLKRKIDFVLVDGIFFDSPIAHRKIIKGDMTCSSIAAASIVAKVHRDNLMKKLDKIVPGYHFAIHKGYGTKLHQNVLKKLGPCSQHRKFYKSIKSL